MLIDSVMRAAEAQTAASASSTGCAVQRSPERAGKGRRHLGIEELALMAGAGGRAVSAIDVKWLSRREGLPGSGCSGIDEELSVGEVENGRGRDGGATERRASVAQRRTAHERCVKDNIEESRVRGPR